MNPLIMSGFARSEFNVIQHAGQTYVMDIQFFQYTKTEKGKLLLYMEFIACFY